jgi:hypothetical protein
VTINNNREKPIEGGKEVISRDNKVVVFNYDGDSILSHFTRMLGNAVKDACAAIAADWPKQLNKMINAAVQAETKTAAANKK